MPRRWPGGHGNGLGHAHPGPLVVRRHVSDAPGQPDVGGQGVEQGLLLDLQQFQACGVVPVLGLGDLRIELDEALPVLAEGDVIDDRLGHRPPTGQFVGVLTLMAGAAVAGRGQVESLDVAAWLPDQVDEVVQANTVGIWRSSSPWITRHTWLSRIRAAFIGAACG